MTNVDAIEVIEGMVVSGAVVTIGAIFVKIIYEVLKP